MQELLYEESALISNPKSAAVKYNIFKTIGVVSIVIIILWAMTIFNVYDFSKGSLVLNIIFVLLPIVFFALLAIIMFRVKNRFYVEYDYILVSGSIRFSKVIKNIKRRFICQFNCSEIEKIGEFGSEVFFKYYNMREVSKNVLTSNRTPQEGKDFYYIVANFNGVKTLFVLECTKEFIINVLKFSQRRVYEEVKK